MRAPVRASISWSESMKDRCNRRATARPTVVFPAPMSPTKNTFAFACPASNSLPFALIPVPILVPFVRELKGKRAALSSRKGLPAALTNAPERYAG